MAARERLARWFEQRLPRPRLREGASGRPRSPVKQVVVFGRIPNPTFDYYLAARLRAPGMPPFQVVDVRGHKTSALDPDGVFAIVCRYASPSVLRWIEDNEPHLAGVGLFLDDDIPAVVMGRDAGFLYRLRLCYRALLPLRRLNRHLDFIWASTPSLASRLGEPKASVLPPAPPSALWTHNHPSACEMTNSGVLIAYHATGIHLEEHRFLRPVIEVILRERPGVRFEVFADRRGRTIWQGLDRVRIRRPLPWEDYVADAKGRCIDIMLVPLTPSHVNDSRAPTKRIDVARYQAAGVFSEGAAYGFPSEDGEVLLPYHADNWRRKILQLVDDPDMRRRVVVATREVVLQMTAAADTGLTVVKGQQARL